MSIDHEGKARANGWVPQEEFKGNAEDWVSAREFNNRGDMIGQIRAAKRENEKLKKEFEEVRSTLTTLSDHHKKTAERVRQETIAELKELKKAAVKEGDGETVVQIDDQLDEIKEEVAAERLQATQQEDVEDLHPEIVAFRDANPGLEDDPIVAGAMIGVTQKLQRENPDSTPKEILEAALEEVKESLPHLFGDDEHEEESAPPQRKASKTLESKTVRKRKSKGPSGSDLDETQAEMGRKFVSMGTFESLDEYAAELAANGDL